MYQSLKNNINYNLSVNKNSNVICQMIQKITQMKKVSKKH